MNKHLVQSIFVKIKKNLVFIVMISFSVSYSQKQMKIHYDFAKTIIRESYFVNSMGQKNGVSKMYTRDGIKEAEMTYKNGVIEGPIKTFYLIIDPNRKDYLKQTGIYKNNKPVSIIDYKYYINGKECETDEEFQKGTCLKYKEVYYKNGSSDREIDYDTSGKVVIDFSENGIFLMNYDNGKPYVKANKSNGLFNGNYCMYNTTGIEIQKGVYKNNVSVGEWIMPRNSAGEYPSKSDLDAPAYLRKVFYKEDGIVDGRSSGPDIIKEKVSVSYYLNGTKRDSCFLADFNNYVETIGPGDYFSYYQNGQLASSGKVSKKCDTLTPNEETDCIGYWVYYYENGKIKKEGTYIDNPEKDPRQGQSWKYYKEDGTLQEEKIW